MIKEAIESFKAELDAHPECRSDLRAEAALAGTPYRHAVFGLGRFPDIEYGEGKHAPPTPQKPPEERLLDYLKGAAAPVKMLNPISPVRGLGKGTGTLPASFGIHLNPELGFTPDSKRPLADVIREGLPCLENSGIFSEMLEDIEVTKALTPPWLKLALPDMQGPFNIAHMILGDEAFIMPLTEPDEWKVFMRLVTDFFIAAHQTLIRRIGPERICTLPFQLHRIAECSVNMVSREFYLEHVLEYDQRIADYFGEVAIHPCSGPHVFRATLENLPNIVYTEAGNMINLMTAGSIKVDEALAAIGTRPIMLSVGEEMPAGGEEAVMRRWLGVAARNPRVMCSGFCGLGWKKADEPAMRNLHQRMNEYYEQIIFHSNGKL
ncbi:MAG: hypothetical protein WCP55_22325 [Lentisphaerota bacterium]